jgi:hypothetical protein
MGRRKPGSVRTCRPAHGGDRCPTWPGPPSRPGAFCARMCGQVCKCMQRSVMRAMRAHVVQRLCNGRRLSVRGRARAREAGGRGPTARHQYLAPGSSDFPHPVGLVGGGPPPASVPSGWFRGCGSALDGRPPLFFPLGREFMLLDPGHRQKLPGKGWLGWPYG